MKKVISGNIHGRLCRYIVAAAVIFLFLATTAGVSYALLKTKTQTAINDFDSAAVNIGIVETDYDNNEAVYEDMDVKERGRYNTGADNINNEYLRITKKHNTQQKSVSIKNITSEDYPTTDTCVRVRLIPSVVYDYSEKNIEEGIAGQTVCMDMKEKVIFDYNEESDNWEFRKLTDDDNDGYYYYKEYLKPGEVTDKLIEGVTYTGDIPDNAHFELMVLADGIAAAQADLLEE